MKDAEVDSAGVIWRAAVFAEREAGGRSINRELNHFVLSDSGFPGALQKRLRYCFEYLSDPGGGPRARVGLPLFMRALSSFR